LSKQPDQGSHRSFFVIMMHRLCRSSPISRAFYSRALCYSSAARRGAGSSSLQRRISAPSSLLEQSHYRFKSSLPQEEEETHHVVDTNVVDTNVVDEKLKHDNDAAPVGSTSSTTTAPRDSTYNKSKSGTPSPWAVFDAWGAGEGIIIPSESDEKLLNKNAVMIPTTETETENSPNETDILQAYDRLLQAKSSVHFGYPYNLMYNHEELYEFMKYSINVSRKTRFKHVMTCLSVANRPLCLQSLCSPLCC
jgi:hypothetical protein